MPPLQKTAIISGVSGQDGAYLAAWLLQHQYVVIGLTAPGRGNDLFRHDYLGITKQVTIEVVDLTNINACLILLKRFQPDEFYHLAGQSAVAASFADPYATIHYNVNSILTLLEALRVSDIPTKLYYSGSSEVFGNSTQLPITPDTKMQPLNPYGSSKAAGTEFVRMYRNTYGLFAVTGHVFNHESFLRQEHFFVKKVIRTAIAIKKGKLDALRVGNIDLKRDFGDAREYVKAFWHMLQIDSPQDFIIASGTSVSLRAIVYYVLDHLNVGHDKLIQDPTLYRPADALDIYGDNAEIKRKTGWTYDVTFFQVLDELIAEEMQHDASE